MEDGLLSLKWNNHKTTFFEILRLLRDKANFADATLAVEGKFFKVHKLVLSTCSEYFSEIFERTPCKSPVIVLKDVRCQDLESLLDYMYMGEVNVNQTDLALLLKTAESLRIKGLAVPDDDPIRHSSASVHNKSNSLNADDVAKDVPPAKRRKEENSSSSAPSTLSPSKNSSSCGRTLPSSPSHTSHSAKTSTPVTADSGSSRDHQPDIPLVKVELEENEEGEETFNNSDTNYETSNVSTERRGTDFSIDKAEHDPSTYPNANFSSQQTTEMQWEDGENSFPQESFPGDSSSQQTGGARAGLEPIGIVQVALSTDGSGGGGTDISGRSSSLEHAVVRSLATRKCQFQSKRQKTTPLPADEDRLICGNPYAQLEEDCDLISVAASLPPNLQAQPVGDYPCLYCGKLFFYPSSLEKHVRTHTGEKPFRCSQCAYCASQKSHLKTHMLRKHNIKLGNDEERGGEGEKEHQLQLE